MRYSSVMVECQRKGGHTSSSSGMLLCENYIITHGSLIFQHLKNPPDLKNGNEDVAIELPSKSVPKLLENVEFFTYLPKKNMFDKSMAKRKRVQEKLMGQKIQENTNSLVNDIHDQVHCISHEAIMERPPLHKTEKNNNGFIKSNCIDVGHIPNNVEKSVSNYGIGLNEIAQKNEENKLTRLKVEYHSMYFDTQLFSDIKKLFSNSTGWSFSEATSEDELALELYSLSSFVILCIAPGDCLSECLIKAHEFSYIPSRGDPITLSSCPFGNMAPEIFIASITRGIVSNKNLTDTLLITDARCVMGGEGGPVYCNGDNSLCGFVLSPYCWLNGEWLGITLLASAKCLLMNLLSNLKAMEESKVSQISACSLPCYRLLLKPHLQDQVSSLLQNAEALLPLTESAKLHSMNLLSQSTKPVSLNKSDIDLILNSTVGIVCNTHSGSQCNGTGVVVNASKGVIVTCAHVTSNAVDKKVNLILSNGVRCGGKVIYETMPFHVMKKYEESITDKVCDHSNIDTWDIAIIVSDYCFKNFLPLSSEVPSEGSEVFLCGYGLFGFDCGFCPSISSGTLSKINYATIPKLEQNRGESLKNHSQYLLDCSKVCDNSSLIPIAFQSSCPIYYGDSGGPLIAMHSTKGPSVVGIVVSCTRNLKQKGIFPHINMSVPSWGLANTVGKYCETGDILCLTSLGMKSSQLDVLEKEEYKLKAKL